MPSAETELQRGLSRLIPAIDPSLKAVVNLSRLTAGATMETWSFDAQSENLSLPLILRRGAGQRPPGALPLATEAAVIKAARAAGVPAPTVRYVLTPRDGLGEGFIMERVAGATIPRKILTDPQLARTRAQLPRQLGSIAAAIHAIDISSLSLQLLDAAGQLREARALYERQPLESAVFELAFRWLREHLPEQVPPVLVHSDFRLGNLIVAPEGVRAVLDWELAHAGDPAEDLAWCCLPPWRFGHLDRPVAGLGSRDDLLEAYRNGGGTDIQPRRLKWWDVLGSLRWGVACASMTDWVRSGRDRTIERAMIARRASENEIDLLRLLAPRE